MAGHSSLAKLITLPPVMIAPLRAATELPNAKLEALHRFTTIVVRERGFATDADIDAFLAAGHTRRNVFEGILGLATKVLSIKGASRHTMRRLRFTRSLSAPPLN